MDLTAHIQKACKFRWPLFALLCLFPILGGCGGGPLNLATIIEQLILGLILGSVYALIALGYTLVYGVIKLINFAHGDIYMLGAFLGYYLLRFTIRWLHFGNGLSLIWCFIISAIISAIICAALAVLMERLAYRPLRNSTRIAALITAVGVSFLLENAGIIVFGPNPKSYEPKTLEIYQVQLADNSEFSGAQNIEVMDSAQKSFAKSRFRETTYARVRIVSKNGTSEWGPELTISPDQANGYVELAADDPLRGNRDTSPAILPSIGYLTQEEVGKHLTTLSWAQGASSDIRMRSVFSNAEGEPLVFMLPVGTKASTNVDPGAPNPGSDQQQFVRIPVFYIVIVVITLVLLWLLNLLINRSMFGISMRALSFDSDAAKLMGVNTDLVIAQTFAIGGACAAIAGNMIGIYNQSIEPLMGILPGIKAFVAAVVGGIGSIPGAAAGGMIMGLSEAFVKGNINPAYSNMADAVAFAILILVLLFKPSGIFGLSTREKV